MIDRLERFAWDHPTISGVVAVAVMVALFGFVGGVERGSIPLPF